MKVTFLGTGTSQGVPVIACDCEVCLSLDFRDNRTRSSILVENNGDLILIDIGTDFRTQILRERIKKIDAILLTHEHKDHTGGLDDIRPFNFKYGIDIPVYARKTVLEQLKTEYNYIFGGTAYPGAPKVTLNEIKNEQFSFNQTSIQPIEGLHGKLLVFGYRINDFTYITDMNSISSEELEKVKGSKVLVINALQKQAHGSHFRLDQALDIIEEINPNSAYLTHLSHRMGMHGEVEKELPEHVKIAYDGLKITI